MTSLATKRRTVSMISSRTSASVAAVVGGATSVMRERYIRSDVDVDLESGEECFRWLRPLMHHGLEQAAAPVRRPRRGPRRRRARGRSGTSTALSNAFARHLAGRGVGRRRPGGGDDDEPRRVRRRGPRHQQARRRRRAAQPGVEGASRSATRSSSPRPVHAVADGDGRRRCSASASAPTRVTDLDDAATVDARSPADDRTAVAVDGARDDRRVGARVQLGHDRAAQGGAPHPPLDGPRHRALGARPSASAPTTASRWPRRRRTSSACSTCSPRPTAGATVRLHRRFDLDEVLRRIESDRMTLEMAVAPIALAMANHPDLEDYDLSSLRYIMWGATPVSESVAERRHRAHRRPLAAGLRRQRAAGDRRATRSTDPTRWRLDSAGLPPDGRRAAGRRPRHRRGPAAGRDRRDPGAAARR